MKRNFSFYWEGKWNRANIIPHLRKDGMHFEVNVPGFDRFYLRKGALGRYEPIHSSPVLPDDLVLALDDLIEQQFHFK